MSRCPPRTETGSVQILLDRFEVKEVYVRGPSGLEEIDYALSLGYKMREAIPARSQEVREEQACQAQPPDPPGRPSQKCAACKRTLMIE